MKYHICIILVCAFYSNLHYGMLRVRKFRNKSDYGMFRVQKTVYNPLQRKPPCNTLQKVQKTADLQVYKNPCSQEKQKTSRKQEQPSYQNLPRLFRQLEKKDTETIIRALKNKHLKTAIDLGYYVLLNTKKSQSEKIQLIQSLKIRNGIPLNDVENLSFMEAFSKLFSSAENPFFDTPTILHTAARNNKLSLLEAILPHCSYEKINITDDDKGNSPLHIASQSRNSKIAKLLIKRNAQVNLPNKFGKTPLICAVSNFSFDKLDELVNTVEVLLRHGSNVMHKDKNGKTALDYVEKMLDCLDRCSIPHLEKVITVIPEETATYETLYNLLNEAKQKANSRKN